MGIYARKKTVFLRLSDAEHAAVSAAARKEARTVTDWVRGAVMAATQTIQSPAHLAAGRAPGGVSKKLRRSPKHGKSKRRTSTKKKKR